jgi:hypothetical protein
MVEADLEEVRGRRIARDVPAELGRLAVGAHHHRQRVPAHQRGDARLDLEVALVGRLLRERNGVDVRRGEHLRQRHAARARMLQQPPQQEGGTLRTLVRDERVEGLDPLARLERIGIGVVRVADGAGDAGVHQLILSATIRGIDLRAICQRSFRWA